MDGKTTIKYLQTFIRQKDYRPELLKDYFLKLTEEVGELSRAMRKGLKAPSPEEIKGTVDEELWDVIYYAIAMANLYDIDLEQVIKTKSRMNESRYPSWWCLRKTGSFPLDFAPGIWYSIKAAYCGLRGEVCPGEEAIRSA